MVRSKSSIMGTGSFAFGFRRIQDANIVINKMRSLESENENIRVWYTTICPDKFVMTTASPLKSTPCPIRELFVVQSVPTDYFLNEMVDSNLSVRLIDQVAIEHESYILYSSQGYEPYHTSEAATTLLERQFLF